MSKKLFGLFAEIFFTAGAVVALFILYQLWFTTAVAKVEQVQIASAIARELPTARESQQAEVAQVIEIGEISGIGLLYIPALRDQVWGLPIISGTSERALAQGVGHYSKTEMPGEIGNFAIAGHRATYGEPFAYFERLREGDQVFIETSVGWFSYELVRDQKIQETEVWVLDDDPIGLGEQRLLTLTTCDPRWNSTRRWAWWGVQVDFSQQAPEAVSQ